MTLLRLFETVHGHLAVLAAAALLHPAVLLRKGRAITRAMAWSIWLTVLFVVAAFGTGLSIYRDYRAAVKPELFQEHPAVALLFETKEHIAWSVLVLTVGATAVALLAPREARSMRRAAALMYLVAAVICAVTVCVGTYVASVRSFPFSG